ncbi:MAG: AMP-binding protein, partial [Thermoleophilia bacterium]|nr:AMP-binding protein [Thermoleophilia bacterium]
LLDLAGREADGIVAAWASPGEVRARLARAAAARAGTGRGPLACALYAYALPVGARAEAEAWLRPEADALGTTPTRLVRWLEGMGGLTGPPGAIREALAAHRDAGVTDAILVLPNRVPAEALDALAEAVLPAPAPVAAGPGGSPTAPRHNLAHLLVRAHVEAGRGDARAVADPDGTWTFAGLEDAAARAAGALADRGVRPGDRVAVALPDGRPWVAAVVGAAWLGAVAVPLDPADPARLAVILADCEPAAAVTADPPPHGPWAWVRPADLAVAEPRPLAAVHPDDLAYLVYSSGSTGRPKGAMHAHRDMAVSIAGYFGDVLGVGPGDACHSVAKGFASLGFGNGFFRPLGRGACAVMSPVRPTPRSVLATVARHRVSVLTGVPTFWAQLAEFLDRHPEHAGALTGLRLGVSSGDALPPAVGERIRARGLDLVEGLGCSECSHVVLSTRPGEPRPGTLGRVVPGAEVSLRDDEGHRVPVGVPGRLWIRSVSNTSGYWRRAAETRALLIGRWVRMGDVLVAEPGGVHRHLGRSDSLFKVDARWVSPPEVEAVLMERGEVREAAVVGRADDRGLVRAAAHVVLAADPPPDLAERLRRHVAHRLGPHAAPAWVTVHDALPRLPSGKIARRELLPDEELREGPG